MAVGVLNTVLSLFYYLRVVKVMVIDPEPADRTAPEIPLSSLPGVFFHAGRVHVAAVFIFRRRGDAGPERRREPFYVVDSMLTLTHSAEILDVLQGVLRTLCRGLPQYLVEAKPWLQSEDTAFLAVEGI